MHPGGRFIRPSSQKHWSWHLCCRRRTPLQMSLSPHTFIHIRTCQKYVHTHTTQNASWWKVHPAIISGMLILTFVWGGAYHRRIRIAGTHLERLNNLLAQFSVCFCGESGRWAGCLCLYVCVWLCLYVCQHACYFTHTHTHTCMHAYKLN